MDHDNWMSQAIRGFEFSGSSSNNNKKSTTNTTTAELSRYESDMAQAKLMRRNQPQPRTIPGSSSSGLSAADMSMGLKGLDQAKKYRLSGHLQKSLKLYELSIELLIKCLKNPEGSFDKSDLAVIETKVHTALSDAEAVKALIKTQQQELSPRFNNNKNQQENDIFQSMSTALKSALKPKERQQNIRRNSNRKITTSSISPKSNQTPSPKQSSPNSIVSDPLKQTILSDFYVSPASLQHTTWNDIAGLQNVKQSLQETAILPFIRPDLFTGLRRPQNIILWGPPGTGKTMLVRAAAQESGSSLFVCSSSTLTSKWMGEAEKLVRRLFQIARELSPSILFIDEMDALLSSRKSDGGEHEASRRLKTEFMVQMDGITKGNNQDDNKSLLLIACTNCPWDVDSAVLRRFPRRIYVPLPDDDARKALIKYLLKKIGKHSLTSRQISTLVKKLDGFSCSDISSIASEASFGPLRSLGGIDAIKDCSVNDVRPVSLQDFNDVLIDATKSVSDKQLQRYDDWRKQQQAAG